LFSLKAIFSEVFSLWGKKFEIKNTKIREKLSGCSIVTTSFGIKINLFVLLSWIGKIFKKWFLYVSKSDLFLLRRFQSDSSCQFHVEGRSWLIFSLK
jgi:hypothetical protein